MAVIVRCGRTSLCSETLHSNHFVRAKRYSLEAAGGNYQSHIILPLPSLFAHDTEVAPSYLVIFFVPKNSSIAALHLPAWLPTNISPTASFLASLIIFSECNFFTRSCRLLFAFKPVQALNFKVSTFGTAWSVLVEAVHWKVVLSVAATWVQSARVTTAIFSAQAHMGLPGMFLAYPRCVKWSYMLT